MNNLFVFDIETIPDLAAARKLHDFPADLPDNDVAEALFKLRREQTGNDFLPHYLQRIVAISCVLRSSQQLNVWSLGEPDSSEDDLIERFYAGIDKFSPILISWNGAGFDLPVIHYRSLLHGIAGTRYWETGQQDQSFRWNNYLNRFHERHTDVMDVLAGYQNRAFAPLDAIATLCGFPGKVGMSGDKVWDQYQAGNIEAIRNYCESDVLNTYLVYLRLQLIQGKLTDQQYQQETALVMDFCQSSDKQHLQQFLANWDQHES